MGTKHRLTSLKSKHAFVDHLPPRSPCSCCLQTKKALSHPLRGASLRSAPHSSRNEYNVFPLCEHCLPCFYLAWPKMCPRELSQKPPQRPKSAPREAPQRCPEELQRGSPRGSKKGPVFGPLVVQKTYGFSLVLQQKRKPV